MSSGVYPGYRWPQSLAAGVRTVEPMQPGFSRALLVASFLIGLPIVVLAVVALPVLFLFYTVDFVNDVGPIGVLGLTVFVPLGLLVVYWAALAAVTPATAALNDEANDSTRALFLLLTPVGLGLAFLLWQLQTIIVYDVLGIDPWLYNIVLDPIGLGT